MAQRPEMIMPMQGVRTHRDPLGVLLVVLLILEFINVAVLMLMAHNCGML